MIANTFSAITLKDRSSLSIFGKNIDTKSDNMNTKTIWKSDMTLIKDTDAIPIA